MWRLVSFIGLTFLFFPSQTSGAGEIGLAVANSAIVQPVHYSKLYGWHCGMRNYDHRHKETCQWSRGGYWDDSEEYRAWRRRSFGAGGRPLEN